MRLSELAQEIGAELRVKSDRDADREIVRVAPIERAEEGSITFLSSSEYAHYLSQVSPSAIIVREEIMDSSIPQILHKNPHFAFAKCAQLFFQVKHDFHGISPQAFIDASARLGDNVTIFPFAYIGANAVIGSHSVIYPGVYVGSEVVIEEYTIIYPNVVIGDRCQVGKRVTIHGGTVIGADGFGFAKGEGEIVKIPQTGKVIIEDDVEIGACCTIDRATMGETRIKRGTKFDSKVHIGHNVVVGENCLFSALTGVAGSTKIGNWVTAGGNSGFNGHIEVKDGATIGAKAGVTHSIGPGGVWMGFPAVPAGQWRRQHVYVKRIPDQEKKVKELEKRLQDLENLLRNSVTSPENSLNS